MNIRWLLICVSVAVVGCGGANPAPVDGPVSVSGKVADKDGKPIGDATLNLQPLENGYAQAVEVKRDGSFTVETTPGKYAYFFTPKKGAKAVTSKLSLYAEPSMDRTLSVASGRAADIQLP